MQKEAIQVQNPAKKYQRANREPGVPTRGLHPVFGLTQLCVSDDSLLIKSAHTNA
jgi:hypothetical protein